MEEKILKELESIKKELQDIRSILEPTKDSINFIPEDSDGIHFDFSKSIKNTPS